MAKCCFTDRKSTRLNSSHANIYPLSLPDALPICAIAAPATGLAFPHCIPAGLMPPVVGAARDGEVLLHPDDLGPDLESAGLQAPRHFGGVNTRMPNVGDGTGKQH